MTGLDLASGLDAAPADRFDTALLDLDGVVYVGPDAVPGAAEAVNDVRRRGMRTAFVTNNAWRTPEQVAAHLRDLGIAAEADDVVTSAQAAATLLVDLVPAGAAVLVVGGEGLRSALLERGLHPVDSADDEPAAVVQGYSPDVGWRLLSEGTFAVRRGLPWVATNLDATVPTPRGAAPGNGALVDLIRRTVHVEPTAVAGKPEIALHQESMRRSGAQHPLVVGDRLDTDIEGANRADVPSLLVLSGVASAADVVRAPVQLRPTLLAEDLRDGLLRAHPAVRSGEGGWSCAGWSVRRDGELSGHGPRIDAVRAACVAVWSGHVDVDAVVQAVDELRG